MTIRRIERTIIERRAFPDAPSVLHVISREIQRQGCDCRTYIGTRLDRNEGTFSISPCDRHWTAANRAYKRLTSMPPSPEDVADLFERLLYEELREER